MESLLFGLDLQIDGTIQLLKVGRVDIDCNWLVLVEQNLAHPTHALVRRVKFQVADGLLGHVARAENLHLGLDTRRVGNCTHRHTVEQGTSVGSTAAVLDDHLGECLIDGCRVAQVDGCQTQAENDGKHEPLPIQD